MILRSIVWVVSSFSDKCVLGREEEEFEYSQYENFEMDLFGEKKEKKASQSTFPLVVY